VILLLAVAAAVAGPTSFSSLKILPGVRETGMGGAGVASAEGPQAMAWNPSATAGVSGFAATAAYAKWLLDTHHQSLFVARNLKFARLGFGVVSFSAGEFEYRTGPTEQPIGTFTPTEFSFYFNVSRPVGEMVQFGLTGRYFYSRIMDSDADGLGVDAGLRVRPVEHLTVGASVVDFGKTLSYEREVFWLPTRGRVGVSYDEELFAQGRLIATADGAFFFYSRDADARAGLEFAWHELALRAGYSFLSETHLSFGMGVRLGGLRLDYSFASLGFDLGAAHRLSVGIGD
jgi:hypothetical protein